MSVIQLPRWQDETRPATSDVDIVIPVHNESEQLAASVTSLRSYLDASFPFSATITIADNASTDDTWQIATELADTLVGVEAIHLEQKGRGRALRAAWSRSCSSVVAYMDVDLATELDALLPLVAPLLSGHSDVAIGSRLATGAHVVRGTKREFISRGYNLLLRAALRSACTDAQCGFKAMRRDAAAELLPLVEDNEWFFDTEVLVTAQRIGLRIHEVPVDWVDDLDSRVDVVHTALEDLRGVARLLGPSARQRALLRPARPAGPAGPARSAGPQTLSAAADGAAPADRGVTTSVEGLSTLTAVAPSRPEWAPLSLGGPTDATLATPTRRASDQQVFADELLRFAGVGAVSTVAYAALFAALEPALGSYVANTVAIGLCSLGNTAAHRGMAGTARLGLDRRHRVLAAGSLLAVSLSVSTGALAATRAVGLTSLVPELCAVTAANAGAAVVRFAILRSWIFRPEFGTHLAVVEAADRTDRPGHGLPVGMVSPS
jgi:putative flippase GtrA